MTAPIRATWRGGWARLAEAALAVLPVDEVEGIWQFQPIRLERRELGTAILALRDGDRRRIWTARYALTIRGRERGAFEHSLEEVGSGPVEALEELLAERAPPTGRGRRADAGAGRPVARGSPRWRTSAVRRRPASSSASTGTSAIIAFPSRRSEP